MATAKLQFDDRGDGQATPTEVQHDAHQQYGFSHDCLPSGLVRFEVSLQKEAGTSFGLAHTLIEEGGTSMLLICEIRLDGPIAVWNQDSIQRQRHEQVIQRADRIISVCGERDAETMRAMLRKDTVAFVIERWPETFSVQLRKTEASERFGVRTEYIRRQDGGQALLIAQVSNGLLCDWNEQAQAAGHFSLVVSPGTEIVQVGSVAGHPEAMQKEMSLSSNLEVVLRRPVRLELERARRTPQPLGSDPAHVPKAAPESSSEPP